MEEITVIGTKDKSQWQPVVGNETKRLMEYLNLPRESAETVVKETHEILSLCGSPSTSLNQEIGLVFGYIQSGKTMSFTALTALAKDNDFRMIIVIAGISTNLVSQSFTRLEKDLQVDEDSGWQWLSFRNPRLNDVTTRSQLETAIDQWRDATFPDSEKRTILITVMKQKNHLVNLQELLESLDLEGVPTLIIDDEGDQHSMNAKARSNAKKGTSEVTVIHNRVVELKNSIPHHTFIQYTATPQAPLFIDIMDSLSPNFIQLLTAGPDYAGGRSFFTENNNLVRIIDDIDPQHDLQSPPASLRYALQVFFLGVVKGQPNREGKNRSMMIHPSKLTYTHSDYYRFVKTIQQSFYDVLSLPDGSPDKEELLEEFRAAYVDLSQTSHDLPSFELLAGDRLRHSIKSTVIQSLNSNRGNQTSVQWRNSYSWILIGGQAMDRGFTVEGLTVTYMPRSIGVGNADTIQQRARFFGYKRHYLGYCRVYLDQDAYDTYVGYVDHEENMRQRLAEHKKTNKSLDEWYREVFLPSGINLARPSVFSKEFERTILGGKWSTIKKPNQSDVINDQNLSCFSSFAEKYQFDESGKYPVLETRLSNVYDDLLDGLKFTNSVDINDYSALLDLLGFRLEENPDEMCTVFQLSTPQNPRVRSLTAKGLINQLFQGRNERSEGLRDLKGTGITFQVYVLNLSDNDEVVARNVPTLATFIPEEMGKELIRWAI